MRSLYVSTAPTIEPVTVEEAKAFCRIDTADDDALVAALISAARQASENYTNRAYINQSITYVTDTTSMFIPLPRVPYSSCTSVKYIDADNTWQTMTVSVSYDVTKRGEAGVVTLLVAPDVDERGVATVEVIYVAGYGATAATVPAALKQAVLMRVAALYENRGVPAVDNQDAQLLERPYKVMTVGAGL